MLPALPLDFPAATVNLWHHLSGCSSVVERKLPKLDVVGSIPIARSSPFKALTSFDWVSTGGFYTRFYTLCSPSGLIEPADQVTHRGGVTDITPNDSVHVLLLPGHHFRDFTL